MKFFLTLIVVLALGAGGYFWWSKTASKNGSGENPDRPGTAVVEARDIRFAVSAAGDVGPADQVSVRPEVNGRIAEMPVDVGDKVAKDCLLCRLDDRDLQSERQQRVGEIDGARLQLEKSQRNFSRNKALFAEKLVSVEAYEDSKTEYELATNSLARAESALRLVEDRLSKTKILAPFDCTVLTRPVSIGQAVSGSGGFNAGTEIMTIANLNDMIINAHINQADVIRLTKGQAVDIQVESVPGLKMVGILDRVAPQAVIKNGIKGFAARIALKDLDLRVRPGMTAILSIPVASADNVLAVPLAAVFTDKNDRYVFVKQGETFEHRPVVIGITDFSYAEVQQGLTAGEIVSLEQVAEASPDKPEKPGNATGSRRISAGISPSPGGLAGSSSNGRAGTPGRDQTTRRSPGS